ncbi:unnamed protein product [Prorocentrum cordatum]|uniref:Protein xylosyltransferase n=1 Tax=Prorocentrum cordatum TaxID=2364126 RepID=A0ABN9Y6P1_9DINO|nr:unnamed protein product [Polarella glacialis]
MTTRARGSYQHLLLAVGGICVYCLGVFHGSSRGVASLSAEQYGEIASQAMFPMQSFVPDPLASGCNWDIVYHVWSNVSATAGSCEEANPFVDCCGDGQCAGFLRHTSHWGQCYKFAEMPDQLVAHEWTPEPLELFDSAAVASQWSFYLKRPVKEPGSASWPSSGKPPPLLRPTPAPPSPPPSAEARRPEPPLHTRPLEQTGTAEEVHVVFTVDCRPFNLWQSELLFFSALSAGQPGPLTAIVSGCDESMRDHLQERHRALAWPPRFTQYFVEAFNDATSIWLSKPHGFYQWYSKAGPSRDVLALVDPDFVFLRPLTAKLDTAAAPRDWAGPVPTRVQKGFVVGQRYENLRPQLDSTLYHFNFEGHNMSEDEFLSWVCSGDKDGETGCRGLTLYEFGTFHGSGVPYIAHRDDWDWLAPDWNSINARLHKYAPKGYYIDMWSWSLVTAHRGRRQFIQENLMLSSAVASFEDWQAVEALRVDACYTDVEEILSFLIPGRSPQQALPGHQAPNFLHYCLPIYVPYPSFKDQDGGRLWSKYWFDWGVERGRPHALERCNDTANAPMVGPYPALKWFKTSPPRRAQPNQSMPITELRNRFLGCVAKGIFRKAVQALCPGQPMAGDVMESTDPLDE